MECILIVRLHTRLKAVYSYITKVAKRAGINPGLLRQYASLVKHPSATQAKKLENTIHQLADELKEAMLYAE